MPVDKFTIQVNEAFAVQAIKAARSLFADALRELPVVTEADGSRWIDAEAIAKLADVLSA